MVSREGTHRSIRQGVLTTTVLCAIASSGCHARPFVSHDTWGTDKLLHFTVSTAIASGSYAVSATVIPEIPLRAAVSMGVTVGVGLGKEILDSAGLGTPSWVDLAWDVLGGIVGMFAASTIDSITRTVR